jgi:hypothetical protein
MVEKFITPGSNVVIDFVRYQAGRGSPVKAPAMSPRCCRHCGAALLDGENEDDCSSVLGSALIDESCLRIVPRKMRVE